MPKLEISAPAPDFTLDDSTGTSVTLSGYRSTSNVLLVFNRGFLWPYCRAHMAQLRQDYEKFKTANTTVIAVGPDSQKEFAKYWEENSIPFIGLPDPKHSVLKLYGQEVRLFKLGRMPAQFIIDKAGMMRYVHYGESMSDIPKNDEILKVLNEINNES